MYIVRAFAVGTMISCDFAPENCPIIGGHDIDDGGMSDLMLVVDADVRTDGRRHYLNE